MLKIQKILEIETILVSHQTNCLKTCKSHMDDDNCRNDCTRKDKPAYWGCSWT
ncbi:hypothetical protein NSA24_07495 [Clostridioides mangenotii]|uniref:hypothetical protein n=1 Tax=Metaclostridioides mangenotii TaxID=1540 RepID=UPI002149C0BE|nr:hypothetical protein [Clostridioides mangenotii]MCR1954635.1 hypothetical protein [Clostridioides mangenotii]